LYSAWSRSLRSTGRGEGYRSPWGRETAREVEEGKENRRIDDVTSFSARRTKKGERERERER
jgi:hypothetical protein